MAERITGRKVITLDAREYRTLLQALEYTIIHEGRGNVRQRCRELLRDLDDTRANELAYQETVDRRRGDHIPGLPDWLRPGLFPESRTEPPPKINLDNLAGGGD